MKIERKKATEGVKKKEALVDPESVDRKIGNQPQQEVAEETNSANGSTSSEDGVSTLLLGGVLGALLVLILSKVLKNLS